jgi:FkbM family methyltransferase
MKLDLMTLRFLGSERNFFYRPGSSDLGVIKQMFDDKDYDFHRLRREDEIYAYVETAIAQGKRPLIVDAGANIGASSLYFSSRFPAALVVAVEPAADNFELLEENTRGLPIRAICSAVACTDSQYAVIESEDGFWAYQTRPLRPDESAGVRGITIDEIYRETEAECFPFIVKVDIEGAEQDLFSKNVAWVAKTPIIIIELHDWLFAKKGTSRPFLAAIAGLDRDFVYIGENIFSIANNLEEFLPQRPARTALDARAHKVGRSAND